MQLATEVIEVVVEGNNVYFRNDVGNTMATIDGLKLSKLGVVKEFPELKNDPEWKAKSIERFKSKIKDCKTEEHAVRYIIKDLSKHGYKPTIIKRRGFRPKKC